MSEPPHDHEFPPPEVIEAARADWARDPTAMRARIMDAAAPDIVSKMKAMWRATSEEAAAGAMNRDEPCVVTSIETYPCPTCFKLMWAATKVGPDLTAEALFSTLKIYNQCARRVIWMGERKWVCDICMAPIPDIDMIDPQWDKIRESQNAHRNSLN